MSCARLIRQLPKRAIDLTPKERRIAALVAEGLTNREIGEVVGNTENAIKANYIKVIFDKCGVWSRLELALWWLRREEPYEVTGSNSITIRDIDRARATRDRSHMGAVHGL